jgi:hypothetical protein
MAILKKKKKKFMVRRYKQMDWQMASSWYKSTTPL